MVPEGSSWPMVTEPSEDRARCPLRTGSGEPGRPHLDLMGDILKMLASLIGKASLCHLKQNFSNFLTTTHRIKYTLHCNLVSIYTCFLDLKWVTGKDIHP